MVFDLSAEGTKREFKVAVERRKPKSWLKTVSAFANTAGGVLVFGVDDEKHAVIGLSDPQGDTEFITSKIRERIQPVPVFEITLIAYEGVKVLELKVRSDMHTPHYYCGDGRREAYTRIGDRSEKAPHERLNELILRGNNETYDSLNSGITLNEASFTVLKASYKTATGSEFEESNFASFGLLYRDKPILANAGALIADEPLVRHSRVFCTRWNGVNKDDALDDAEFSGGLLFLLRESTAFVARHNTIAWEKAPENRVDRPSYARRAITEALVNALIHRDYLLTGSEINIDIYDDRMVISSPGSMFEGGVLPERPDECEVKSRRRNPILADLFHRLGLMERRGSGLRRICKATINQANFRPEFMPQFSVENGVFAVTLMDMNYRTPHV
ncbi:MAG: putative DNA binding domain-containing protein, partial [Actinomycetaceae bacterium]|nr:putative DNA binding domain-containing protein [Actinomycetaceae bacterium]